MQDPAMLYLALLLHDTGRALNQAHHATASADLVAKVCRRLSITGESRRLLLFLVDNHLELYRTATKLNTEDPAVIADFAKVVRNQNYLDALLVFTVVDSKGTSAGSWSSWKESLILQLYRNTSHYLNDPTDFMRRATEPLDDLKVAVQKLFDATYGTEIDAHFAHMPRAYFNFREARSIAYHIRAIRWHQERVAQKEQAEDMPTLTWINHGEQGWSDYIVVCRDRPLLLARLAGALAAHNINILSADLFRRGDGVVLDLFRVCTVNFEPVGSDRTRMRVKASTEESFRSEHFDFSQQIAEHRRPLRGLQEIAEIPQRVYVTNDRSAEHTVIELQAADRIGLLYHIFNSIGRLGLNITHARINTEKGAALDTFYVQTMDGQKVMERETLDALREALNKAVFS
jgi:[protein-PII] uridylyltransferase